MSKQNPTERPFTPKQNAMLEAAMKVGIGRSITMMCKEADVSRPTFYDWMKNDPNFVAEWEALPMKMVNKHLPGIISAQLFVARTGDTKAARLMLDYAGQLKQRHEHSGPGGAPIRHDHKVISQPERQKGIMKILERAGALDFESLPMGGDNGHGNGS